MSGKISATLGSIAAVGVAAAGALSYYFVKQSDAKHLKEDAKWTNEAINQAFLDAWPKLLREFLDHAKTVHELPPHALERLEYMFNYNCMGGKMNRGLMTCWTARDICADRKMSFSERVDKAIVLGWCIEVLQACFLVADDIMDHSLTRRNQPCWYLVPTVQLDAINDTLILESLIYFLLQKHFSGTEIYTRLMELYHEVSFQTQMGQMLDLMNQPQGRKGKEILDRCTMELYKQIVRYKTAYYSFYLPFAGGMILCGLSQPDKLKIAQNIAIELGEKFQIEDDFLDCYGDPVAIGKHGTDIQDHKCSWLVVQALNRVSAEQRKVLEENYGKTDDASVAKVKALYLELNLKAVYDKQEDDSYERIKAMIKKHEKDIPPVVFEGILKKIHKRQK